MPPALDPEHPNSHPAYICGQLLALHDSLQYTTAKMSDEGQPNATVADRFYTLVMNSPAVGMAKVFELGRKHLTKMRRKSERGARLAFWYEGQIGQLEQGLPNQDVPHSFGLHDKARFALGFYHQKAYRLKKSNTAVQTAQTDILIAENPLDIEDFYNDNEPASQESE